MRDESPIDRRLTVVLTCLAFWLVACGGCFDFSLGGGCASAPSFHSDTPTFTPDTDGLGEGGLVYAVLDPLVGSTGGSCVETVRVTTLESVDLQCLPTRITAIGATLAGYVLVLDSGGTRAALLNPHRELAAGVRGGNDIAVSPFGRYAVVLGSNELLAIDFSANPYNESSWTLTSLGVGTAQSLRAVIGFPLAILADFEDPEEAIELYEPGFAIAGTGTAGGFARGLYFDGSPGLSPPIRVAHPTCNSSASALRYSGEELGIWDASCNAAYRVITGAQDTSATISYAPAGAARSLEWSHRTREFFTLGLQTEIAFEFPATVGTTGAFSTPATAQVAGYSGSRIWIATLPLDSSFGPSLSVFEPATRAIASDAYTFAVPGTFVRRLAYLDRPPAIAAQPFPPSIQAGEEYVLSLQASDPDGDPITSFTQTGGPGTSTSSDGFLTYRWTPACTDAGPRYAYFAATAAGWTAAGTLEMDVPECD